jgi:hypothetical protein
MVLIVPILEFFSCFLSPSPNLLLKRVLRFRFSWSRFAANMKYLEALMGRKLYNKTLAKGHT